MKIEIKVPSVGESVSEADIGAWEKEEGSFVRKGETLVVLETDKASMEVPAEEDGVLSIKKKKGQVQVGDVLGFIDSSKSEGKKPAQEVSKNKEVPKKEPVPQRKKELKEKSPLSDGLSPSVRRLVEEKKIDPSTISGSGRGGRLTKEDILKALEESSEETKTSSSFSSSSSQTREPMTRLRRVTAEKLVQSQHQTATLSTFNEADMSRIIEIRKKYGESFLKNHGVKLGFMSFFVKACVAALRQYPKINAFIDGTDILYNSSQHIGIAVSMKQGLVVPVIFEAERLSLAEIEKKILEFIDKAQKRKLSPDDLIGGTFTVSNGGVFGSLLSTPILNPPQSGILGMHKIEERPVAINGKVEIRPMMYLTLSYDHRIVDGRESVGFLVKVKEILEEPARLLVDI